MSNCEKLSRRLWTNSVLFTNLNVTCAMRVMLVSHAVTFTNVLTNTKAVHHQLASIFATNIRCRPPRRRRRRRPVGETADCHMLLRMIRQIKVSSDRLDTLICGIILSNIWQSAVSPYIKEAQKAAKLLNKDLFFKSALLILTVSTNAFHSTNSFCCFSRCQEPTNSLAPYFRI